MAVLRPKEAAIMALWDAGASLEAIACSTGQSKAKVTAIVCLFDGAASERTHKAEMRRGSAFLLKAIQLTGKRHRSVVRPVGLAL